MSFALNILFFTVFQRKNMFPSLSFLLESSVSHPVSEAYKSQITSSTQSSNIPVNGYFMWLDIKTNPLPFYINLIILADYWRSFHCVFQKIQEYLGYLKWSYSLLFLRAPRSGTVFVCLLASFPWGFYLYLTNFFCC